MVLKITLQNDNIIEYVLSNNWHYIIYNGITMNEITNNFYKRLCLFNPQDKLIDNSEILNIYEQLRLLNKNEIKNIQIFTSQLTQLDQFNNIIDIIPLNKELLIFDMIIDSVNFDNILLIDKPFFYQFKEYKLYPNGLLLVLFFYSTSYINNYNEEMNMKLIYKLKNNTDIVFNFDSNWYYMCRFAPQQGLNYDAENTCSLIFYNPNTTLFENPDLINFYNENIKDNNDIEQVQILNNDDELIYDSSILHLYYDTTIIKETNQDSNNGLQFIIKYNIIISEQEEENINVN